MSIPDAAVSFLLNNLNQILKYNSHLVADVRDNILALQKELENLKGLMKDYAKYNHDSNCLRELVNDIRTVVRQAEDVVETFIVQAAVEKSRNWISKAFQITDYPQKLRDARKEIEEVGDKVMQINQGKGKAMSVYEVMQHQTFDNLNRHAKGEKKSPKLEEEQIIGFDGAIEEVSKLLTGGSEQFEVISIVGMIGCEKTTLAKKVFKNPNVDYEFMIRAFVHVSKQYEKREVLLKIWRSFGQINDEVNKMSEDQLEKHLHQQLNGKQYLIILDDVSEEEDWNRLKHAFPHNKKRCRVLITTSNEKVAEEASPKIPFYKLDFLPLDKSRELFHREVFWDENCPKKLQEYEIQILEKCGGLPLAIVAIAGIICNHRDRVDWWKYVADGVKNYVEGDQERITKIIELMYVHLPNHLKLCFIYLGVFPEEFETPVWKLVRLWIAEGLIQQEGDLDLEETAEQYSEELVCRNLVIIGQRRSSGKIKTCRIHDTLLKYCKNKAIEENLFQEITKDNLSFFLSGNEALDQYSRLCINNVNVVDYISKRPSGKCVRSFLAFRKEVTFVEPKFVSSIPKSFKLLRVLEVESLIFHSFPINLCDLVLLKYIAISSNFSALPSAMSNMWNLQTLIVKTSSPTLEIKADIWQMPQLRHLHTNTSTILICPDAKSQKTEEALTGKNIQTLSTISPKSCRQEVLDRTPNIKKLGICGALTKLFEVKGECTLFGNLGKLEFLENLKLLNDLTTRLYSLPSEKSFPTKLINLTLKNTLLDWKDVSTLGKLENLEVLKLKDNAFEGKLWETEKGGFLRLKHLHIGRTDLVIWEASADHFPKLKCLELRHCDELQALPQDLADILTLQLVVLHYTNPSVASSAIKLQMLKLEQEQKCNTNSNFKLYIYPPDHRLSKKLEI